MMTADGRNLPSDADDADDADPPGYVEPTSRQIWRGRIEVHRRRGEHAIAEILHARMLADEKVKRNSARDNDDDDDDPRLTLISDMMISQTLRGILEARNIVYAGELAGFTVRQLREIRGFGNRTVRELIEALAKLGIHLRPSRPSR